MFGFIAVLAVGVRFVWKLVKPAVVEKATSWFSPRKDYIDVEYVSEGVTYTPQSPIQDMINRIAMLIMSYLGWNMA